LSCPGLVYVRELAGRRVTAEQGIQKLDLELEQRIRSMALIHEMLYASVNLADLDFGEYLH
jgi:two-component sensor histidine kinase